jgi:hypothetical protein
MASRNLRLIIPRKGDPTETKEFARFASSIVSSYTPIGALPSLDLLIEEKAIAACKTKQCNETPLIVLTNRMIVFPSFVSSRYGIENFLSMVLKRLTRPYRHFFVDNGVFEVLKKLHATCRRSFFRSKLVVVQLFEDGVNLLRGMKDVSSHSQQNIR